MGNAFIGRQQIHHWVDDIDANKASHKQAINYLLTSQRALSRFVAVQSKQVGIASSRQILFIQGAMLRVFDLQGGKLRTVTAEHIANAEELVSAAVSHVLPIDDGFAGRVRQVSWRAQPHFVDELLMSLFDNPELSQADCAKLFFLMWVVLEAIDAAWTPNADFEGLSSYVYAPVGNDD